MLDNREIAILSRWWDGLHHGRLLRLVHTDDL
jgi:hypothetical protein